MQNFKVSMKPKTSTNWKESEKNKMLWNKIRKKSPGNLYVSDHMLRYNGKEQNCMKTISDLLDA